MLTDVVVDVLLRPLDDRVDLHHLAPGVPLDDLGIGPGVGLLPADAGDPGIVGLERLLERNDLAQVAAQVRVARVQLGAKLRVLLFHRRRRGDIDHIDRVHDRDGISGADRLGEVVARVEEEHVDPGDMPCGEVHDHCVGHRRRDAQTGAECLGGPLDDLVG